ncbi:MAG: hypothetical protein JO022_15200, partial [Acidobacteriaceae bacterium]|nr:hypothetical protein [Acidobacteriaceae bacterium]
MTLAYLPRLVCLALACYFLLQAALSAIIWFAAPHAVRAVSSWRPRSAATWLLTLRLAPAFTAFLGVAILCVPSYVYFEGRATEHAGLFCLTAALLSASAFALAAWRSGRSLW